MSWTREEPWQNKGNFIRPGPATRAASEEVGRGRPTHEEPVGTQAYGTKPIRGVRPPQWDRAFAAMSRPYPHSGTGN